HLPHASTNNRRVQRRVALEVAELWSLVLSIQVLTIVSQDHLSAKDEATLQAQGKEILLCPRKIRHFQNPMNLQISETGLGHHSRRLLEIYEASQPLEPARSQDSRGSHR